MANTYWSALIAIISFIVCSISKILLIILLKEQLSRIIMMFVYSNCFSIKNIKVNNQSFINYFNIIKRLNFGNLYIKYKVFIYI